MTTDGKDLPDLAPDAARNRASWDAYSDEYQATHAEALDKAGGLTWGASEVPELDLHVLGDIADKDSSHRPDAGPLRPSGACAAGDHRGVFVSWRRSLTLTSW